MQTVSVRLSDDDYALLSAFAEAQGTSRGAVFVECFELLRPQFENVVRLVAAARSVMPESKAEILRALEVAEQRIAPVAADLVMAMQELSDVVDGAAEQGGTRSRGVPAAAAKKAPAVRKPPSSNTGVRSGGSRGVARSGKGKGHAL